MIPKKIHFCWLSGDEYPPLIKYCLDTWKKILPDYEIILWDTNRFDINSVQWVKEAYEAKKYAFAADYIRVYALYTEGGIYLDSDVEMLKSFNPLLKYSSFIGFEASTGGVEAAIMGAEAGSEWCKNAMDFYEDKHFDMDKNGGVNLSITAPNIVNKALKLSFPDFPSAPPPEGPQIIGDCTKIYVCPAEFFSPIKYDIEKSYKTLNKISAKYKQNKNTYCIHRFNASWGIKPNTNLQIRDYLKKKGSAFLGSRTMETLLRYFHKLFK